MKNCENISTFEAFLNENSVIFEVTKETTRSKTYEISNKAQIIIELSYNGRMTITDSEGYYSAKWNPEDTAMKSYILNLIFSN